ncbi:MAG: DHH family phosphoesterase, partial [Clostridiales bacterium]|nr:DHH family phosphoesterase [Clostridiales bacterium]
MGTRFRLSRALKAYLRWPILLSILLISMNICVYMMNRKAGLVAMGFVILYVVIVLLLYIFNRPSIMGELVRYAADYGQVQKQLLKEMALPYAVLDYEGRLLWGNNEFLDIIEKEKAAQKTISNIFPEITEEVLPRDMQDKVVRVTRNQSYYRIVMRKIIAMDLSDDVLLGEQEEDKDISDSNSLIALYVHDETENRILARENYEQKMIMGLLYIDNYEEALETIDEVRRSLLIALVDRKINKYMQSMDAIIKKLEKDK